MKFRTIVGEAARDIVSGTSRVVLYSLVFGLMVGLPVSADAITTTALLSDAYEFEDSGAAIATVAAPQSINGQSCEALSSVSNVRASGALRTTNEDLVISTLPSSPVDLYYVTPGFLKVLKAGRWGSPGVTMTADVSEAIGVSVRQLETDRGPVSVAGTFEYPADGRRTGFGWAALAPSDDQEMFDECWVAIWPYSDELRSTLLTVVAASPAPDSEVTIAQLNTQYGRQFLGSEKYESRFTVLNPLSLAGIGFLAALFSIRPRRLELSSRLHDGASKSSLVLLMLLETSVWLILGGILGVSTATLFSSSVASADSLLVLETELWSGVCAVLGGMIGSIAGVSLIRERHLFAYFKDR